MGDGAMAIGDGLFVINCLLKYLLGERGVLGVLIGLGIYVSLFACRGFQNSHFAGSTSLWIDILQRGLV